MFYGSSGSMYEEIEKNRLAKERKKKILLRRIIAIIILSLIVIYLSLLFIDTRRYKRGLNPLITISIKTKEYDDGYVKTYTSIGWVFRYYERETITDSELVSIFSKIRLDNVLKRNNDPNLPEPENDYEVPSNSTNDEKVDNVLFFYKDDTLLGTYACLLSKEDCEISYSDILEDDATNEDIKMGIIDSRYVFITEYKNKDTEAEEKHVYLYDINAKNYIAEYEGVRYTTISNDQKGYIDSSKYIVKKNGLWGIDQVIKGQVSNYLDYTNYYIKYSSETNLYIVKNNNKKWATYNAQTKEFTEEIPYKIENLYVVNGKTYFITYEKEYSSKKNYKLFNENGENVLNKDAIDNLVAYDTFLVFTNDNVLYIIDYDGNLLISGIPLFIEDWQENAKIKQYKISIKNDILQISVPQSTSTTHLVNEYYYYLADFTLQRQRLNVQETTTY